MAHKKTSVHLAAHAYAASLTALISLLFAASPARADYAPQRGDVLEIDVSGAPVLNRRFTVNGDGRIVYPVVGEVEVADHPLAELKRHLQDMLASRNIVRHPDVIISVAEYGPVYVSGDVLRPGEFRYQPEMTVGNAVALAIDGDVVKRLGQKESNARAALLREVVDPSKVIDPKYRTRLIETSDGERLAGIVIEETDAALRVAANAARPDEVRTIPKSQIERMKTTDVSLMPVGLLNVLTLEEILDLLAFVERGGK